MDKKLIIIIILLYIALVCRKPSGYFSFLPSKEKYFPNSSVELNSVLNHIKSRTKKDEQFHYLTDRSVSEAFAILLKKNGIKTCVKHLDKLITDSSITNFIMKKKIKYNRIRPYQLYPKINKLYSKTANTPAFPAGHAFQAYLLAKLISKKHPNLKDKLYNLAYKCDIVRIKAGLHYPSDGKYSKLLIEKYYKV